MLARAVKADRENVVFARMRLAAGMLFAGTICFVVADASTGFEASPALIAIQASLFVLCGLFLWTGSRPGLEKFAIPFAILASFLIIAATAAQAVVRGQGQTSVLLFAVYGMAAAALLPWGVRAQAVTVAGILAALVWVVHTLGTPFTSVFDLPTSVGLALAMGYSLVVAYEIARYRAENVAEHLRLRSSGERLRASENRVRVLNTELEHRVKERTSELNDALGEMKSFNSAVSHDLRQPLRSVDGMLAILTEEAGPKLTAEQSEYIARSRSSVVRMGRMIDDLLALSRVREAQLERQVVDLSEMAMRIVSELQESDPGRVVVVNVADGLKAAADPGLLGLVLQNLIGNAWKFTSHQAEALIEFGAAPKGDGATTYYVRDNGVGFDMAHAGQLFGTFQRLQSNEEFEGTGIGLATVDRIVRRHGGSVWAESKPGQGAVFHFTLGPAACAGAD